MLVKAILRYFEMPDYSFLMENTAESQTYQKSGYGSGRGFGIYREEGFSGSSKKHSKTSLVFLQQKEDKQEEGHLTSTNLHSRSQIL